MCKKPCFERCPFCGHDLVSVAKSEEEVLEEIKQKQLEAHPEVSEDDPQDGCEHLVSIKRRDEGAESADEMGKQSNR